MKLGWLFPLTVISILGLSEPVWAGKLIYWKFNKPLNRIEIISDEGMQPQAQFMSNPGRLIIDLPDTTVDKAKQKKKQRVARQIREVRVGQFTPTTTRLVVELRSDYTLNPNEIKIRNLSPSRWFIQLPQIVRQDVIPSRNQTAIALEGMGGVSRPATILPPPAMAKPTLTSSPPPLKAGAKVVVIDPGHGGGDPGAVGINGLQEKGVVLSVATQVAEQLRRKGMNAILTRTDDREIDLAPRVAKAEGVKADIFVSIHANSISLSRPDINGLETYYYSSKEGYKLARAIHSSVLNGTTIQDRGVRQARFYVIRRTSMPSVLVEIGFVTGAQDAARLSSPAQRTKLAEAITQGILNYLQR
ncbi:MAG TPA: N-acetylmuramoyl-L-alanine amidase [Stenomitos sp.]